MGKFSKLKLVLVFGVSFSLAGCGGILSSNAPDSESDTPESVDPSFSPNTDNIGSGETTIWNIFGSRDSETRTSVNRYLWSASLEVLSFLPVQSVDPFTGVIVTGYGTPPGGRQAYRATVLIDDPALDARSLSLALQSPGGRTVSKETTRAVEDAILTRARELRIADNKF